MNAYGYANAPYPDPSTNGAAIMDLTDADLNAYASGIEGQSLDDIVSQNDKANRRQSMPVYTRTPSQHQQHHQQQQHHQHHPHHQHPSMHMTSPTRSLSMMNFGDPNGASMDDFAFDMASTTSMDNMMRNNTFPRPTSDMHPDRMPGADLVIKTQFSNATSPFSTMAAPGSTYASPMHANAELDMSMSPFPNPMNMPLDMDDSLGMMQSDMNMFSNTQFNPSMMESPVNTNPNPNTNPVNQGTDFIGPLPAPQKGSNMVGQHQFGGMQPQNQQQQSQNQNQNHVQHQIQNRAHGHFNSPSMSGTPDGRSGPSGPSLPSRQNSHGQGQGQGQSRSSSRQQSEQRHDTNNGASATQLSLSSLENQKPIALDPTKDLPKEELDRIKNMKLPWQEPPGGFPSMMNSNPHMKTQFKNAYSSSGFDMLGVLMRVATRPNPQIDIGSVDLSCAFVVCDADMDDIPIVYCSENFERLTGYTRHMILGRNCRFLQSPDGKVEAGIKRNYVDDDSVLYLKNTISAATEAQISLINYRRGGQPFMNLLTMIPISWEPGGKVKFFIGFQVDLVEQPGAMTNKNAGKFTYSPSFCTV
jgi:PAS domain-containing protein